MKKIHKKINNPKLYKHGTLFYNELIGDDIRSIMFYFKHKDSDFSERVFISSIDIKSDCELQILIKLVVQYILDLFKHTNHFINFANSFSVLRH